jgi:hypothetical protein
MTTALAKTCFLNVKKLLNDGMDLMRWQGDGKKQSQRNEQQIWRN